MRPILAAASLSLLAAACAPPPAAGPQASSAASARRCFHSQDVTGFREAGARTFDVTVRANETWRLETFGACRDAGSALGVLLETTGGPGVVCNAADAQLIVPTLSGPRRCPVRTLRPLAPGEVRSPAG